ncbi:MAG: flippase-like domain-containing protein [Sphingobacteriales bacterium]|nr:MAG: flippase-like domain-containing protein [Sphingobacteriales bacterium]
MRKKIFSVLQYIIFLGAGIFLVWWQLRTMTASEKAEFNNALWSVNYWLMIPVVLMSLLSHLSRSMRWKILMEPLAYQPKLKNVFASTMVGYLANSAIPRLGEVLKCTLLARYEKLKFDKLFGTILVERAFDFVCYLAFIGITILLQLNLIGGYVNDKIQAMGQSSGMPFWAKMILVVAAIASLFIVLKWLVTRFPHNAFIAKVSGFLKGIAAGFVAIKHLRHKKMFLVHTLIIWSLYMLQIYIGFSAMEGTGHLGIKAAFSVLSLATLAMIATPGGIGSFPIFVMETLLIYSIDSPVGKAFGWLIWGANTAIVIVAGLIALLLLPYMNRRNMPEP